jgi:hypothetical protein
VVVVAPYAVTVPLVFMIADRLDVATAAGLVALVLAPGALLAPALVNAAGGRRRDMAGALLLGTVILSFVLVLTRPAASTLALTAAQAFVVASLGAGALPHVRDRILVPLRWAGYVGGLVVFLVAIVGPPAIGAGAVIAALGIVVATLVVAGAAALALHRDVFSAVAAAGTRDPIVAIALAWATGGSEATAVPLVSAAILGIVAAALVLRPR